jgi:hypothetical protein
VRHRVLLGPVLDPIGHQSPPPTLLAQGPACQLPLNDRIHLQTHRVVFAIAVGFARKQGDEVDEDGAVRMDATKHGAKRLPAVPDLLHRHGSIICSKGDAGNRWTIVMSRDIGDSSGSGHR